MSVGLALSTLIEEFGVMLSAILRAYYNSIQRPFFEGCFSMLFDAHGQRRVLLPLLLTSAYFLNAFETEERIGCTTRVAE